MSRRQTSARIDVLCMTTINTHGGLHASDHKGGLHTKTSFNRECKKMARKVAAENFGMFRD